VGTSETLEFDAPQQKGGIPFMCSMGMYKGVINVI
jgi:plastocyanin domain-containing protein